MNSWFLLIFSPFLFLIETFFFFFNIIFKHMSMKTCKNCWLIHAVLTTTGTTLHWLFLHYPTYTHSRNSSALSKKKFVLNEWSTTASHKEAIEAFLHNKKQVSIPPNYIMTTVLVGGVISLCPAFYQSIYLLLY